MIETEARAKALKVQKNYAANIAAIRAHPDLSDKAKQRALAAEYVRRRAELRALRDEHDTAVRLERQQLQQKVFANADQAGYRAALDSAAGLKDAFAASQALDRAERTGDELLAQAVLTIAVEKRWGGVVNAYVAHRPETAEALAALDRFVAAEEDPTEKVLSPMRHLAVPPELPHHNDAAIQRLAQSAPAGV